MVQRRHGKRVSKHSRREDLSGIITSRLPVIRKQSNIVRPREDGSPRTYLTFLLTYNGTSCGMTLYCRYPLQRRSQQIRQENR
jgi:hypothetical protein